MAKKTNKTSHVLNLITNGLPSEPETPAPPEQPADSPAQALSPTAQQSAKALAPSAQPVTQAMAVLEAAAAEDHAAALRENAAALRESAAALREAVAPTEEEKDLEGGEAGDGPSPDKTAEPSGGTSSPEETKAVPEQETASPQKTPSFQETASPQKASPPQETPPPPQEPAVIKAGPVKEPQTRQVPLGDKNVIVVNKSGENDKISNEILNHLTSHLEEEDIAKQEIYCMVNVMEQILEHTNLDRYMEKYGVCRCSRCRADIKALILTRLPAKYVVVDENSVAPIIGYYENRYRVRILTEIIKACIDVKEAPRHGRPDIIQCIRG